MASLLLAGKTWLTAKPAGELTHSMSALIAGKLYRLTQVERVRGGVKIMGVRTSPARPYSMQRKRMVLPEDAVVLVEEP